MGGMPDDKGPWLAFGTSLAHAGTFAMRSALGWACSRRAACSPSQQRWFLASGAGVARW
jgi:hypothetical protein